MGMCESRIFNKNKSNKNNIETNILKNKMNYDLQFTRYLYEKDEVKLSLIISILNKKEEAIFWAYELFYLQNSTTFAHQGPPLSLIPIHF